MYDNAHSKVRITNSFSNPINGSVGLHQGFELSPFLFTIVMEALSCRFRTGCSWELFYADDLVIVVGSLGKLKVRLRNWKDALEENDSRQMLGSLVL